MMPHDELDPARRAMMRSLLVDHARADAAGAPARARRRRLTGAIAGFTAVAAVTATAVLIAVAGVPLFSAPPAATDGPVPSPTSSPSPAPTSTPPAPTPPAPTPALPTPAPVPTSAPAADAPPTVEQFRAAVVAAGFDCSTWEPQSADGPSAAIDGGWCLPAELWFTSFSTDADVTQVLERNYESLETARLLYGPRWIVGTDDVDGYSDDLLALQTLLGGTTSWDPAENSGTVAGYDALQLWNLCAAEGEADTPGAAAGDYRLSAVHAPLDGGEGVEVYVSWNKPAEPTPTPAIWICRFSGDPSAPTLDSLSAKDV